jgi:deoxycytidylate deaminase
MGPVFRIITMKGDFTATPNHPVLIAGRGWVPTQTLAKGDYLFHPVRTKRKAAKTPHDYDGVVIKDVFDATAILGFTVRKKIAGHQFHGDALSDQSIDVVVPDYSLRHSFQSNAREFIDEPFFSGPNHTQRSSTGNGALLQTFGRTNHFPTLFSAHGSVPQRPDFGVCASSDSGITQATIDNYLGDTVSTNEIRGRLSGFVSRNELRNIELNRCLFTMSDKILGHFAKYATRTQTFLNGGVTDTERLGDIKNGLAGLIASDEIVAIEQHWWAGHVYNLSTQTGWFQAGSAASIIHNCGHLHGEENAIINCDVPRYTPKVVLCTHLPCALCAKRLVNLGGVERVVYETDYRIRDAVEILERAHIKLERFDEATTR